MNPAFAFEAIVSGGTHGPDPDLVTWTTVTCACVWSSAGGGLLGHPQPLAGRLELRRSPHPSQGFTRAPPRSACNPPALTLELPTRATWVLAHHGPPYPGRQYGVGAGPQSAASGGLDGDDRVSILLGVGGGGFGRATNLVVGSCPDAVAIGDVDGAPDLAVADSTSNDV